jgi:hypothetical protein
VSRGSKKFQKIIVDQMVKIDILSVTFG